MAGFVAALPNIIGGVSAVAAISQGQQNADALKMQAIVSRQQAAADEEAQRRDARQYRGAAAAALAEAGLTPDGSSGMMVNQSAALAELDALNIRYRGALRSNGLLSEAAATRRSANMLAGQKLLGTFADNYRPKAA